MTNRDRRGDPLARLGCGARPPGRTRTDGRRIVQHPDAVRHRRGPFGDAAQSARSTRPTSARSKAGQKADFTRRRLSRPPLPGDGRADRSRLDQHRHRGRAAGRSSSSQRGDQLRGAAGGGQPQRTAAPRHDRDRDHPHREHRHAAAGPQRRAALQPRRRKRPPAAAGSKSTSGSSGEGRRRRSASAAGSRSRCCRTTARSRRSTWSPARATAGSPRSPREELKPGHEGGHRDQGGDEVTSCARSSRSNGSPRPTARGRRRSRRSKGIDLTIDEGDFVAVMGPSGSGKSTMMNILGCLDTPTSGVFRFRGVEVQAMTRDQRSLLRRKYLGFVFQGFNLLARTSGARERRAAAALPRREEGGARARRRWTRSTRSGWRRGPTTPRPSCRAGSSSAWRSPARWSATRPCCWPTSRPATSTPSARSRSCTCSTHLNRAGITILMVTHEAEMAAFARTDRPFPRRAGREHRAGVRAQAGRRGSARLMFGATLLLALREIQPPPAALVPDHARHHHRHRRGGDHGHARQGRHRLGRGADQLARHQCLLHLPGAGRQPAAAADGHGRRARGAASRSPA